MDWKTACPKARKPSLNDIAAYLGGERGALFSRFAVTLRDRWGLGYTKPVWTAAHGWTLQFGASGYILLYDTRFADGRFFVEGIAVDDEPSLEQAIGRAEALYGDGFERRFADFKRERSAAQKARTEARKRREAAEKASLDAIDPARYNRFRWPPAVARRAIEQLYRADARGFRDETLADEVGWAMAARCAESLEIWRLREEGRLRCPDCRAILPLAAGLMRCACGWQCHARDYYRSYRAANMPAGAATPLFAEFAGKWPSAVGYTEKMRLIDWMIHQFHANLISGARGRSVAVNLIAGSRAQVGRMIFSLAYGGEAGRAQYEAWLARLSDAERGEYQGT